MVSEVDVTTENTYKITYSATSNEKTVSVERTVIVLDMKPIITMTEPNENYVTEEDILVSVSAVRPNELKSFEIETIKDGVSINKETINDTVTELYLDETGIYEIVVSALDNNNHTSQMSKTYKIDTTGPVITFEEDPVYLESEEVEDYDIYEGVYIEDNVDGVIDVNSDVVTTSGSLNKQTLGEQTITYTVSDELGNETEKDRTFIITDLTKPEIVISPKEQVTYVQEKTVSIKSTDNIKVSNVNCVMIKDGVRGNSVEIT